ncbi:MAG: hypothetical protein RLO08_18355 [Parvibaculaceae bacterium]
MVNERTSTLSRQEPPGSGFSGSVAFSSFVGTLFAGLLGAGAYIALAPEPAPSSGPAGSAPRAAQDLTVPADGTEAFFDIDAQPTPVRLTFDAAGEYRVELRALTGASDPVLALFAGDSPAVTATNDDAPGTLDAIVPVSVSDTDQTWRVEMASFGETSGPTVLRVLPGGVSFEMASPANGGIGAFPDGEITVLSSDEPVEATVGAQGVWYHIEPRTSDVYVLSVRAADDGFDTIGTLLPVLPGAETPSAGVDIASLGTAFTSDDDDGLNPRFQRYLQEGADYYLFVRSFEEGAQGSVAISLMAAGDTDDTVVPDTGMSEENGMDAEPEMAPETDAAPAPSETNSGKLNSR